MNSRIDNYIREQKEKLQAMILRHEPIGDSLPARIVDLAMREPVLVDSILFDGYMRGLQDRKLTDIKKSEES